MSEIKGFMSPSLQHAIAKDHGALEGERNELRAERDQLRQQVEKLLGSIQAHRSALQSGGFQGAASPLSVVDRTLYQAADQVRKELEGRG